jgi:hypothetical protein
MNDACTAASLQSRDQRSRSSDLDADSGIPVGADDLVPIEAVNEHRIFGRPDPMYHGVLLAFSAAVVLLAAVLSVRGGTQVLIPFTDIPLPELCLTRRWYGLDCPGCGMTRCFISLAHGDLVAAWAYNPAGPLLFAIVAFQLPFRSLQLWRIRRGLPEMTWGLIPPLALGTVAVMMIGQWLLKLCGVSI